MAFNHKCVCSILVNKIFCFPQYEGIEVSRTQNPKTKIHEQVKSPNDIVFGQNFSDHMLVANWTKEEGWLKPQIIPYGNLSLSPALSALHYSTEVSHVTISLTISLGPQ